MKDVAGIINVEEDERIEKRFLKEWLDVVISCDGYVNEKILVTNDLDTERILIHGFCYTGKERGWYGRKVKESLVHEVDKYGDLIFTPEVSHPQKSITYFSNSGVNSNLKMNSPKYRLFLAKRPFRNKLSLNFTAKLSNQNQFFFVFNWYRKVAWNFFLIKLI